MGKVDQIREALKNNANVKYEELDHVFFSFVEEEEDGFHDSPHQIAFSVKPQVQVGGSNKERIAFAHSLVPTLGPYHYWSGGEMLYYDFREVVGQRILEVVVDDRELKKHPYAEKLTDGRRREVRNLYRTIDLRIHFSTAFKHPCEWWEK